MDSDSRERKMFYGAKGISFIRAKRLRRKETGAEKMLWQRLKGKQLHGIRFRRQHTVGRYIVDFYCHQAKLVIEVDGGYHNTREQQLYDRLRTEELENYGLTVVRFSNEEVFHDIDNVLEKIAECLPSPPISPL